MKVGEKYRSIWNGYIAKIIKIDSKYVYLENLGQRVIERVGISNFDLNWKSCDIENYVDLISTLFKGHNMYVTHDKISIDNNIAFSMEQDSFIVRFAPYLQNKLKLDSNEFSFTLNDTEEIIYMIADLVSEV